MARLTFLAIAILSCVPAHLEASAIQITADLTDSARHLYHAEIDLPVQPGPLTLTSPLWIPGSHSPNGPIGEITGLVFTAAGRALPWRRDDLSLSQFHLEIPAGISTLRVHLDALAPSRATRNLAMLEWDQLMLYPAGIPVRNIAIEPSVRIPPGWSVATALTPLTQENNLTHYTATNVEQLEDSPVLTGRYFREYGIAPGANPPHYFDIAGDKPEDATVPPAVVQALTDLVGQARLEYASSHFHAYHFLVTRSDFAGGGGGLEHGQSTDIGIDRLTFTDPTHTLAAADLFAHEYTHSWNGKYRRPSGLYRPDFATPVDPSLLWIYEGLTQYLGDVLATRAGLKSTQDFREMLAFVAADLDDEPGRRWRSTEDTARGVTLVRGHPGWYNWRRGKDYYGEGELLWLDVDTLLRQLSGNRKSLDDFAALFFGRGGNTGPEILPYDLAEVVADLDSLARYDWAAFLHDRVANLHPHADLAGLERGGYRLVYRAQPQPAETVFTDPSSVLYTGADFWFSLGLRVDEAGRLLDVRWGSPADNGTLAPRQKLLTVNGAKYTSAALRAAVATSAVNHQPIRLTAQAEGESFSTAISYFGGERFPALERIGNAPAALDAITAPRR